jgi:hypothetical protein
MVKARFTSLVVPETGAKETKIRLALWGFTCHVYPDLQWISDFAQFMKAPPGVSVSSSEQNRLLTFLRSSNQLSLQNERLFLSQLQTYQSRHMPLATLALQSYTLAKLS